MADALVLDVDHTLGMGIAKVTLMRGARVDLELVEGVLDFVGEDACGEARDDLLDLGLMRGFEDVVVDQDIVAQEGELQKKR